MQCLLQMKVTPEFVAELTQMLKDISDIHKRETDAHESTAMSVALKAEGEVEQKKLLVAFNMRSSRFRARAQRLTMQNLLRLLIKSGMIQYRGNLLKLLAEISDQGITRGRPKNA